MNKRFYAAQDVVVDKPSYSVFVMNKKIEDDSLSFEIKAKNVNLEDYKLTYSQVLEVIENKFKEFPTIEVDKSTHELIFDKGHYHHNYRCLNFYKAVSNVAMKTRRGVANIRWNDTFYYNGSHSVDCPIIVSKNLSTGLYAVVFHDDFLDYGFNVKEV